MLSIRPDAVALVDSFGFLDMQLHSTIGRKDGKVYEAIYAQAKKNPLNGESYSCNRRNHPHMPWSTWSDRTSEPVAAHVMHDLILARSARSFSF